MKVFFGVSLACALAAVAQAEAAEPAGARPDLVARVTAGELKEARASWWGYDPDDATKALQAAVRSGVKKLIVDKMPAPWTVRPIRGVSDQEIVFADGVEVRAKKGAFKGISECLFTYDWCTNVVLRGEGAALLRMNRGDYTNATLYAPSEWRNGIRLCSCRNVTVENLTIAETGGDGVYVGWRAPGGPCTDIVLRNLVCERNCRQGLSITCAENVLVEGCTFRQTSGRSPQSGVDIEPNRNTDVLKNIVLKDCTSVDNDGCGFEVMIFHLDRSSEPVSIRFENCRSSGNRRKYRFTRPTNFVRSFWGRYEFVNCHIAEMGHDPVSFTMDGSLPKDAAGREIPIVDADAARLARATPVDTAPGKSVRTSTLAFRGKTRLWFYAGRPGPVVLKGVLSKAGGGARSAGKPLKATVTSADGRWKAALTEARDEKGEGTFSTEVPAAGFYSFDFHSGSLKWAFTETTVPLAATAGRGVREPGLNGVAGDAWFWVPAGTASLAFIPAGGGDSERVAAGLFAPDGARAWSVDNVGYSSLFVSERPASGLWRIRADRPSTGVLDDFSLDVLGVPLCLFLSPEKYWKW